MNIDSNFNEIKKSDQNWIVNGEPVFNDTYVQLNLNLKNAQISETWVS